MEINYFDDDDVFIKNHHIPPRYRLEKNYFSPWFGSSQQQDHQNRQGNYDSDNNLEGRHQTDIRQTSDCRNKLPT